MFAAERCAVGLYAAGLALLLLLLPVVPSMAQTWPQRPVKFVVTLGPGSGVDFGTRLLGDRLSKRWGQPVVIENRPGGDAVVAVTAVISANDDHVLLASPTSALTAHPYMCLCSRIASGRVVRSPGLKRKGFVASDNLQPWKARILLALALSKTTNADDIQRMFDTY